MNKLLTLLFVVVAMQLQAQDYRWQQKVDYKMEIDFDVTKHQFKGKQLLTYTNNSNDTLRRVFYHLYFNAFQPNSMMDVRSRNISDPDGRVKDRIFHLKEDEIGYHHIHSLKQDGKAVSYKVVGTILEVTLNKAILPGKKSVFNMDFESQVPKQIRRSGRDNAEGIDYSMAQWYPKMSEYDFQGWHANPYIGREFHGVWGDFDVEITIDPSYTLAATGILQNKNKIGYGYEDKGVQVKKSTKPVTWNFKAENVHDFMWAADPDYVHKTLTAENCPDLHFFYDPQSATVENWDKLPELTAKAFQYVNKHYGVYPYPKFNVIQGGDGGMEYPMGTLITGKRSMGSLTGVTVHEMLHSWYQGVLATNESLLSWMDEGFTSYVSSETMGHLFPKEGNVHAGSYRGYYYMAKSGKEEPLTTHADHYITNQSYGINSYSKGAVFLHQLNYILGEATFKKGMRRYFNSWKFRHPNPTDMRRILEKTSGIELDWYYEHFVGTTNTIDYSIEQVVEQAGKTYVTLKRKENMMMPIDLVVTYEDGTKELLYIPLRMMRGVKPAEGDIKRTDLEPWPWVLPSYTLELTKPIKSVEIDPSKRLADIDQKNNFFSKEKYTTPYTNPTK